MILYDIITYYIILYNILYVVILYYIIFTYYMLDWPTHPGCSRGKSRFSSVSPTKDVSCHSGGHFFRRKTAAPLDIFFKKTNQSLGILAKLRPLAKGLTFSRLHLKPH